LVQIVDVSPRARAEAEVIDAWTPVGVRVVGVLRIGLADRQRCPATDVVHGSVGTVDSMQIEAGNQLVVERDAFCEPVHAEQDMGNAVDLHRSLTG
jgi:hypothetical protein